MSVTTSSQAAVGIPLHDGHAQHWYQTSSGAAIAVTTHHELLFKQQMSEKPSDI